MTMGDGGVYFSGNNCRFVMNMLEKNSDYVQWVSDVCSEITEAPIRLVNDERQGRKPLLNITTKTNPLFTTLRHRIYTAHYKGIDPHALKLLDWEALAILYMCDGSLYIEQPNEKKQLKNPSYNVTLNLKRLSYGDQLLLKKALKDSLDLEWNIIRHYNYYFLRLRCKDVARFMEYVSPYVLPSFQYKLLSRTGSSTIVDDDIVCASKEFEEISRDD